MRSIDAHGGISIYLYIYLYIQMNRQTDRYICVLSIIYTLQSVISYTIQATKKYQQGQKWHTVAQREEKGKYNQSTSYPQTTSRVSVSVSRLDAGQYITFVSSSYCSIIVDQIQSIQLFPKECIVVFPQTSIIDYSRHRNGQ